MPEFEPLTLALLVTACTIVFVAGLGHGTLGFGFPMIATTLLALLFDVRSAILLTLLPTLAVNVPSILHGGRWSEGIGRHWPLAVYIPLGSILGTKLLVVSDPAPFRLLLAAMIVLYLVQPQRAAGGPLRFLRDNRAVGYAAFGLVAGFLAGTVNVMVPLLIVFTLELGLAPLATVQLFNLCFLSGKLAQVGTFAWLGWLDAALLAAALPMTACAVGALYLGMRVRQRVDAATYRRWLRGSLAVVAVLLVAQYVGGR